MDMRDDIVIRPETPNADGGHADDSDIVMLAPVSVHAEYLHKHIGTGIQYVVKNGAEGRGGMPLLRAQRDIEKYNN